MPSWPAAVPFCPVVDTFRSRPRDNIQRTAMDAGPDLTRRRFTAVSTDLRFTLPDMDLATKSILDDWIRVALDGGALAFDADHPVTGEAKTFRFNAPPEERLSGNLFVISIDLEMLP